MSGYTTIRYRPSWLLIVFFSVTALYLIITTPLTHNPDANYYYSVALRISRGELLASIDGMYAPLISWLMAPLLLFEIAAPYAYRIVALFAYILILTGTSALGETLKLKKKFHFFALFLTGLHLIIFSVTTVTGDLLSAGIFIWFIYLLVTLQWKRGYQRTFCAGVLGSLAYYAKPILLPISCGVTLISILNLFRAKVFSLREITKLCLSTLTPLIVLSSLWIAILSTRYGTPLFTGQQLLSRYPNSRYDYSPDTHAVFRGPDRKGPGIPNGHITRTFESNYERTTFAVSYLWNTLSGLFFGTEALIIWLGLVGIGLTLSFSKLSTKGLFPIGSAVALHFSAHLFLWGPYLRYYFPIYPLCHLLCLVAVEHVSSKVSGIYRLCLLSLVTLVALSSLLICSQAFYQEIHADNRMSMATIYKCLARLRLSQSEVPVKVTGNSTGRLPGLLATLAGVEFWSPLYPQLNEDPELIYNRLMQWKVSEIWWEGPIYPSLEAIPQIHKTDSFRCASSQLSIYKVAAW
jgi:hypothetical protein